MRERISQTLGDDVAKDLFVGNTHRYCSRYIYDNGVVEYSTGILDELDKDSIMNEIADDLDVGKGAVD